MVLRALFILVLPFLFSDGLFDDYQKDITRHIKREFDSKNISYKIIDSGEEDIRKVFIDDEFVGLAIVSSVSACALSGCTDQAPEPIIEGEYFDLLTLVNPNQQIISLYILDYFSDYGYEITSKKYLSKYKGRELCDFREGQHGLDAISGATISCKALQDHLGSLCQYLSDKQ